MHIYQARTISANIINKLKPHCIHISSAGSIRREREHVKDIEIVCRPKTAEILDMFGHPSRFIRSDKFSSCVKHLGKILSGWPDTGRQVVIDLDQGINLDLFIPQPTDYFRILAIRTGNKEYAHSVIANAWTHKGWCGTEDGLRLQKECVKDDYNIWHCTYPKPTMPPAWQSEEEFFAWLGLDWIEPKYRELSRTPLNRA